MRFPTDEDWRQRYERLQVFAALWHADTMGQPPFTETILTEVSAFLEIELPISLLTYYRSLAVLHRAIMKQDSLREPNGLWVEKGLLVFVDENQEVLRWGLLETELTQEDPRVFALETDGAYWDTGETASSFLTRSFVTETVFSAEFQGVVEDPDAKQALLQPTGLKGVSSEVFSYQEESLVWRGPFSAVWASPSAEAGESARRALS